VCRPTFEHYERRIHATHHHAHDYGEPTFLELLTEIKCAHEQWRCIICNGALLTSRFAHRVFADTEYESGDLFESLFNRVRDQIIVDMLEAASNKVMRYNLDRECFNLVLLLDN
jgi:hypothetical protein